MDKEILIVSPEDAGKRLDVFLCGELENVSRSRLKNAIEEGGVLINGRAVLKAGYTVKENDTVEIILEEPEEINAEPEDIPLDIVYQDNDLAVINKRQGMVTHPATGSPTGTLVNAALFHIKDLSGINGKIRPGIVHRLDKDTSGLIVIAKNDAAHNSLAAQIASKSAHRYYIALVDGNIKEDSGKIEAAIDRSKTDRKMMAVSDKGRYALTYYTVLERFLAYTLTEFKLSTGRTHQIRVHCKYIKHPVVGDPVYGGSNKFKLNGQLLHAYKLELTQPSTGERMSFSAPLPVYFEEVLKKLRQK